jgi:hypothetical protein
VTVPVDYQPERRALETKIIWVLGGAALAVTLLWFGLGLPALATVLLVAGLLVARRLLTPVGLIAPVIILVMFIPANIYRLPSVLPFDVEPYRLGVLGLLCVWMVGLLADPKIRLRATPLDVPMLLVVVAAVASFARNAAVFGSAEEFAASAKGVAYILTLVGVYYAIVSIAHSRDSVLRLVRILVISAAICALFAMAERLTGFNVFRQLHSVVPVLEPNEYGLSQLLVRGGRRVMGSAAHPIAFGTMLAMVLPFAIQIPLEEPRGIKRQLWFMTAGLILVGMLLTVSRTAFIGLVVSMVTLAIYRPRERGLLLASSCMLAFVVHMAFPGILRRFVEGFTPSYVLAREVGNAAGRLNDYPFMWAEFVKRPLVGRGVGTFTPDRFFHVDNQYLVFMVEMGMLGMIAALLLFASSAWTLLHRGGKLTGLGGAIVIAAGAAVGVFALATATFDSFGFPQPTYLFFIVLALGVSLLLDGEAETARGPGRG